MKWNEKIQFYSVDGTCKGLGQKTRQFSRDQYYGLSFIEKGWYKSISLARLHQKQWENKSRQILLFYFLIIPLPMCLSIVRKHMFLMRPVN